LDDLSSGGTAPDPPQADRAPEPELPGDVAVPPEPQTEPAAAAASGGEPALDRLKGRRAKLRSRLTGGSRRRRLAAAGAGLGLVLVLIAALVLVARGGGAATGSPAAGVSAGTSVEGTPPAGSGQPVAAGSGNPRSTVEPTQTPSPAQTAPTATITYNDMVLVSTVDGAASAQTLEFTSDGPGAVSAQIVVTSPLNSTKLCLAQDAAPAQCVSGATPGLQVVVATAHSRWVVTLTSANESSPTVDVAISWPTDRPSIALSRGRFQGYPNPDTMRSLTATFVTRGAGLFGLDATWAPAVLRATLTVADPAAGRPTPLASATYSGKTGVSPAYSLAVAAARTYRVVLFDDSPDGTNVDLRATITFP
jgi:hypothetical protein